MRYFKAAIWVATTGLLLSASFADDSVSVQDGGSRLNPATWECTAGHMVRKRNLTIDSGAQSYMFAMSGCMDPAMARRTRPAKARSGCPRPRAATSTRGAF